MSLTICSILQEVLPGAWNDNRDIFQMKIIVTILGRVDNLHLKKMFYDFPWLLEKQKKVPWFSLTTLFSRLSLTFQVGGNPDSTTKILNLVGQTEFG